MFEETQVELRHLRYFIRAAEFLHFTRAAESLYISQPSLSIHIQQLEEELKIKLFARVGRNVHLTEAGQILLVRAKRAVGELEEAGKEIEAMNGLLRGTLSLGTAPLFGSKLLPEYIDAFSLLHPQVHLKVRAARAEEIEAGLIAGTFDMGFSLAPPELPEIHSQEIFSDQIALVLSKSHPLAKRKKLEYSDFESVPMALPSHKVASTRMIGSYFESIGITPNVVVEQDDGHALIELVKLGGFITFLPKLAIRVDPEICCMKLPEPAIPISLAMMWTVLNPASSAFLELVTSKAKAAAAKADSEDD